MTTFSREQMGDVLTLRAISHDEVKEAVQRLVDGHFRNTGKEHGRMSIPANPDRDDDLVLSAYIKQQSLRIAFTQPGPSAGEERQSEREAVIRVIEGGSFLHDDAPPAKFAREVVAAIRRDAERRDRERVPAWECAARKNIGANDPQDCDWPVCGCDPHADKVIEALDESGRLSPIPAGPGAEPVARARAIVEPFRHSSLDVDGLVAAIAAALSPLAQGEPVAISPSDPAMIIAGIRQFGLAADGSDLRELEAALARAHPAPAPSGDLRERAKNIASAYAPMAEHDLQRTIDGLAKAIATFATTERAAGLKEGLDIGYEQGKPDGVREGMERAAGIRPKSDLDGTDGQTHDTFQQGYVVGFNDCLVRYRSAIRSAMQEDGK